VLDRSGLKAMLDRPEGAFDSQLHRNGMETAVSLDAWFDRYRLRLARPNAKNSGPPWLRTGNRVLAELRPA
jgi:hypothetical protein